jgi:hypothetical protein
VLDRTTTASRTDGASTSRTMRKRGYATVTRMQVKLLTARGLASGTTPPPDLISRGPQANLEQWALT